MPNDWIKWEGGDCPVESHRRVDISFRDGRMDWGWSHRLRWGHNGTRGDIVAYRLHQPEAESALHSQEGGDHYKKLAIQPMEYSMANKLDACQHTVVKYVTRFRDKGGIEDLKKAIHTIKLLAKLEYDEEL